MHTSKLNKSWHQFSCFITTLWAGVDCKFMQLVDLKIPCGCIYTDLAIKQGLHTGTVKMDPYKLKDTMKAFNDFKNKQKSVWSNVFWYLKICIFWKCIQYTIHWDKTHMLKRVSSEKINSTKNEFFFLLQSLTHHSFPFLFVSWSTRFVSRKLCVGFSIFNSVSFLLKFIFLFSKMHGLFDFKTS